MGVFKTKSKRKRCFGLSFLNTLMNSNFVLSQKDLGATVTEHQLLETQVSNPEIEKQLGKGSSFCLVLNTSVHCNVRSRNFCYEIEANLISLHPGSWVLGYEIGTRFGSNERVAWKRCE